MCFCIGCWCLSQLLNRTRFRSHVGGAIEPKEPFWQSVAFSLEGRPRPPLDESAERFRSRLENRSPVHPIVCWCPHGSARGSTLNKKVRFWFPANSSRLSSHKSWDIGETFWSRWCYDPSLDLLCQSTRCTSSCQMNTFYVKDKPK